MVKIGDLVITYHTPLPPAPPPLAGEGRPTGNGVMRVLRTRITPFPDLISLKSDDNPC